MKRNVLSIFLAMVCGLTNSMHAQGTARCSTSAISVQQTDSQMQQILKQSLEEYRAKGGLVAVMDVKTGKVSHWASVGLSASGNQLLEQPQPTSLMSTFALEACLQTGRVSLKDSFDTEGGVKKIDGKEIRDHNWPRGGYGNITLEFAYCHNSRIGLMLAIKQAFAQTKEYTTIMQQCYGYNPTAIDVYQYQVCPLKTMQLYDNLASRHDSPVWKAIAWDKEQGFGSRLFDDLPEAWGKTSVVESKKRQIHVTACCYDRLEQP